jgi:predicted DCC family thiol-disulfide oxidoreductase YuxK
MNQSVVFYDNDCKLCSKLVKFAIKRSHSTLFMPLNSGDANTVIKNNLDKIQTLNTVILIENNTTYIKSEAILHILRSMKGFWRFLGILKFIPTSFRDYIYDFVADNRQKLQSKIKIH